MFGENKNNNHNHKKQKQPHLSKLGLNEKSAALLWFLLGPHLSVVSPGGYQGGGSGWFTFCLFCVVNDSVQYMLIEHE